MCVLFIKNTVSRFFAQFCYSSTVVGIEQFGEYRKAKHKKQNCTKNILYTYEHVRCAQNRKKYRALCDCTFDGDVKQHRFCGIVGCRL